MEGAVEGRADDWGQVVTRYPYENVGMDHLLSKEKDVRRKSRRHLKKCLRHDVLTSDVRGSCSVLKDLEILQGKFFEN